MQYIILKQHYLSFGWYIIYVLQGIFSSINYADLQLFCAFLKRRQFIDILCPNLALKFWHYTLFHMH